MKVGSRENMGTGSRKMAKEEPSGRYRYAVSSEVGEEEPDDAEDGPRRADDDVAGGLEHG